MQDWGGGLTALEDSAEGELVGEYTYIRSGSVLYSMQGSMVSEAEYCSTRALGYCLVSVVHAGHHMTFHMHWCGLMQNYCRILNLFAGDIPSTGELQRAIQKPDSGPALQGM